VTNTLSNDVTKLRARNGATLATIPVGNGPQNVAFDGANVWVSNSVSDTVSKL
jgi:YVTN family beta-propeller protein